MKIQLFFTILLVGLFNSGFSQEKTRVTKISIEFNEFSGTEFERDTVVYDILKYPNGDFEKTLIYTTGDSTPFFMVKRVLLDSSDFFSSYYNISAYSSKLFHEYYYGERQTQKIVKKEDSTIIAVVSYSHKKGNPNKVHEAIYTSHERGPFTLEKTKIKSFFFGIIGLRKWEEYSIKLGEFESTQKEVRIFNKRRYYRFPGNKWTCTSISKYKRSKLKWEKQKGSDSMETKCCYDKSGRITKKSIFRNNQKIYSEEYTYT